MCANIKIAEQLEVARIIEQDQIRQFYYFAYYVYEIKKSLKCSICLELFNIPVTLSSCNHTFCKECIQSFCKYAVKSELTCPICAAPFRRNRIQAELFLKSAIDYIKEALNEVYPIFGTAAERQFPSYGEVVRLLRGNENINKMLAKGYDIVEQYKVLLNNSSKSEPNKPRVSSDDKATSQQEVEFHSEEKCNNRNKQLPATKPKIQNSQSSVTGKNLFDKLKKAPAENPLFRNNRLMCNAKTYGVQKQTNKKKNEQYTRYVDKFYDFEDKATKRDIIRWLNDNQNKFDFKPEMKETNVNSQISDFDMPSVSQRFPHKRADAPLFTQIDRQKNEQNRIRQKNETVVRLSRSDYGKHKHDVNNKRGRSLECCIKLIQSKPRLKRHSVTIGEDLHENIDIEQVNSEEEVIFVREYYDSNEKGTVAGIKENRRSKDLTTQDKPNTLGNGKATQKPSKLLESPKRSSRTSSRKSDANESNKKIKSTMDTSSGWNRMNEMKKTISRAERKPRKLTVISRQNSMDTMTSTASDSSKMKSSSNISIKSKSKTSKKSSLEPIVIIENYENNTNPNVINRDSNKNRTNMLLSSGARNENKKSDELSNVAVKTRGKKLPSKLSISIVIPEEDETGTEPEVATNKISNKNRMNVLINLAAENENKESSTNNSNTNKPLVFDIDAIETYFNNNLNKVSAEVAADRSSPHSPVNSIEKKPYSSKDKKLRNSAAIENCDSNKIENGNDVSRQTLKEKNLLQVPKNNDEEKNISETNLKQLKEQNHSGSHSKSRKRLFSSFGCKNDDKIKSSEVKILNCENENIALQEQRPKGNCNAELRENILKLSSNRETDSSVGNHKSNSSSKQGGRSQNKLSISAYNITADIEDEGQKYLADNCNCKAKQKDKLSFSSLLKDDGEMEVSGMKENGSSNCAIHFRKLDTSLANEIKQVVKDHNMFTFNEQQKPLSQIDNTTTSNQNKVGTDKSDKVKQDEGGSNEDDFIFSKPTQNLNANQGVSREISPNDDNDFIFAKSTQVMKENNQSHEKNDDDDDIFLIPTQIIFPTTQTKLETLDKELVTSLKTKVQSLSDIWKTFDKDLKQNAKHSTNILSMQILLRNIKVLLQMDDLSNEESSDSIHELSVTTRAVEVQTDNSLSETNSLFSHSVTTQTKPSGCKHAAIQTDSVDSPKGFQISSGLFNIQSITHAEVQTVPILCPKCNYNFLNSNETVTTSADTLEKSANIINNLAHKYSFSASFDNLDFETQDLIKGKQINSSTSSAKGAKNSQNCTTITLVDPSKEHLEGTNQNVSLQKPKLSSLSLKSHQQVNNREQASQATNNLASKKTFKRIRKPNSDSDSDSDAWSSPLKRSKLVQNMSIHFVSQASKGNSQTNSNDNETSDGFRLSDGSEGINYGEVLDEVLKKVDEETLHKQTALPAVNFAKPAERPAKRQKTQDIIRECEMIIKEACTDTIRIEQTENYANNFNLSKPQDVPGPSKLTLAVLAEELQNNFDDTDTEGSKDGLNTVVNVNATALSNKGVKGKFSESLFDSGDNFSKNINIHEMSFLNDDNQIISVKNKDKKLEPTISKQNQKKAGVDELIDQFNDLNDSFEDQINAEVDAPLKNKESTVVDMDLTPINVRENIILKNDNNGIGKIKILQDVVIGKKDLCLNENKLHEIKRAENKPSVPVDLNISMEEIFDSDEEVIETTPQKNKPANDKMSFLSQTYYNPDEKVILPPLLESHLNIPLSCLDQTFAPPPEFQDFCADDVDKNNEEIVLVGDNEKPLTQPQKTVPMSSLTPDLSLPQPNHNDSQQVNKEEPFITSTPYEQYSQIISARSLNLSPIHPKESNSRLNPILAAQNSKFSPLTTVVRSTKTPPPQKMQPLNTSTPKQKSILKYVRPNESFDHIQTSQLSQTKKLCVACTRMNTQQMLAITALSNKKLISYSSSFSSTVTHMIVAVNDRQCVNDHTMKYVDAVASGIWVLSFNWIEECLKQGRLLPEEPFEALDVSGVAGPKQSRLTRKDNPLLIGYVVHAAPPFVSTTQKEVENVITLLGGKVVPRPDDLLSTNGKVRLIITEVKGSQDFELYEMWLETLKVVTVDLEWLSRSVGQYKALSLKPFMLCTEDSIFELGYPSQLLVEVSDFFSRTTV